ncbi:MAG TPA: MFS transporter [Candidatus Elarobacter sp.]|nr:MFS transporter [Candidatus Elarobacter sp.]
MKPRVYYGWFVVGATFLTLVTVAGILTAPTMFIQPFEKEFGWSDRTISIAIGIQIALFGLTGPFAAAAMERFGVRRTVVSALCLLACAEVGVTFVHAAWQLPIWGACVGLGAGSIALMFGTTIATRWFDARRGIVLGLFAAGNATGALIFLPLFGQIIAHVGWRPCAFILAGVALTLIPLNLLVVRERPSDLGLPRFGATEVDASLPPRVNPIRRAFTTLREATRSRTFWVLAGTFFICGASTNGLIGAHLVPACGDHGIPETRAAGLLAAMGVFDLIGTTASGWLSDRYSSRWLLFWYYGLRGLSLLFLPMAFGFGFLGLPIFAMFYGLDWIATVPPTVKLATAAFGRERAPLFFGWIAAGHQLGAGLTAFVAGAIRSQIGSYDDAFLMSGLLCLIAAGLILTIGRSIAAQATARAIAAKPA